MLTQLSSPAAAGVVSCGWTGSLGDGEVLIDQSAPFDPLMLLKLAIQLLSQLGLNLYTELTVNIL